MRSFRALPALSALAALLACGKEPAARPAADEPAAEVVAAPEPAGCWVADGTAEALAGRPSPLRQITFTVGGVGARLCWGAPSAKGRKIMGGLVPFGEPWRLGANEATALHLTAALRIGEVELQPGAYSFYAVPGEREWAFFLNSAADRWGIPIDDAVRATEVGSFTARPGTTDAPVETLGFRFEGAPDGASGDLVMEWESTRIRIPVRPSAAGARAM